MKLAFFVIYSACTTRLAEKDKYRLERTVFSISAVALVWGWRIVLVNDVALCMVKGAGERCCGIFEACEFGVGGLAWDGVGRLRRSLISLGSSDKDVSQHG